MRTRGGSQVPVRGWIVAAALVGALVAAGGCGSDGPSSPTAPQWPMPGGGVLTTEMRDALHTAIQDEYRAEMTYMKVVATFGEVQPFYNIVYAEVRHSQSIGGLFERYGLPVPASRWNLDNVEGYPSIAAACAAGVEAETANVAMYDRFLAMDLPFDVRNVFANNRAASLENHLPAFQVCCGCAPYSP